MRKTLIVIALVLISLDLLACSPQLPAATRNNVSVEGGTYTNVAPIDLKQMLGAKDFMLVNVHVPYAGELAQTDAFIPYTDIEQNLSKLPAGKNSKIVLYCSSGHMSGIAASTLVKLGYTNIWNLDGGMAAWQNAGFEIVQNKR